MNLYLNEKYSQKRAVEYHLRSVQEGNPGKPNRYSKRESDNLSDRQTCWCTILLEKVATEHSFGRLPSSVLGVTVCLSHHWKLCGNFSALTLFAIPWEDTKLPFGQPLGSMWVEKMMKLTLSTQAYFRNISYYHLGKLSSGLQGRRHTYGTQVYTDRRQIWIKQ